MMHIPFSELDQSERFRRPYQAPVRLRFEHFAMGQHPVAEPTAFIPVEVAEPGDEQVLAARLGEGPYTVDIDRLADRPSVVSVLSAAQVRSRTVLPNVRELLLDFNTRTPDAETLRNLPGLEAIWARWAPSANCHLDPADLPADMTALGIKRQLLGWRERPGEIRTLGRLTELRHLVLRDCFPGESVAILGGIRQLESLECDATSGWPSLRGIGTLTRVHAYRPRIQNLTEFAGWNRLRELLISMGPLESLEGIDAFADLEDLTLMALKIDTLHQIAGLPALRRLLLRDLPNIVEIEPIGRLPALTSLRIEGGTQRRQHMHLRSLQPLANLKGLERLHLQNVDLDDPSVMPLAQLTSLRFLEVMDSATEIGQLRNARPDLAIKVRRTLPGPPVIAIGHIDVLPPWREKARWSIYQDLADLLHQATNPDAEDLVRMAIAGVDRPLLSRLGFDTEGGSVGIYADNESDIRAVARIINDLARSIRPTDQT